MLERHVHVLYTNAVRSTHRFVPPETWFGLETEGDSHYDNSIANHEMLYLRKINFSLPATMKLKRSEMHA